VLTCAGGFGVILADYLADPERPVGASLAEFGSETERRLRQVALSFASVRNPIDLTGSATNQMFDQALEILQDDPNVDAILVSLIPYPPLLYEGIVEVLDKWRRQGRKPLVAIVQGQVFLPHVLQRFWRAGVLAYPGLAQAVRAVGALCQRGEYLMRIGGE
jgi:acyl-CoA synthetase (NDP forming)